MGVWCKTSEEVCAHVAAAVIAMRRAGQEGKRLPSPESAPCPCGVPLHTRGTEPGVRTAAATR